MRSQDIITIGDETTIKVDYYIIKCKGKKIEVIKRGALVHKKLWEYDGK